MNQFSSSDIKSEPVKEYSVQKKPENNLEQNRARLVLKNSGALGVSAVLGKLLYFSLFVLIGRYLGPDDLGKLTFALSFIAIFTVISDLGLNLLTVKEVSADKNLADRYLNNLVVLKAFLAFLAFISVISLAKILGYPKETVKMVFLLGLAAFFTNVSLGIRWIFQVHLKLEYESALSIVQNVLSLSLGYLVLKLHWGIYGIGYSQTLVWILILIAAWILISKRFTPIKFGLDFKFWGMLLKRSVPFALMLVFTGLYLNLDTVLLSLFKGDRAVGLYNAANRLVLAGKMVPGIMIPALFPIMSSISQKSKEEFGRFLGKSLTLIFCMALPISIGTTFLANKMIYLLYGSQFAGSVFALRILIWGMFCMYLSIVVGHGLTAAGYQRINTAICGIGLGVSVLINFLLIPRLSYLGTSVAILSTEVFVMMAVMFCANKVLDFKFKQLLLPFSRVISATLMMSLVLHLTRELNLFLCAGAGIASYFLALFSLGGVYEYDLRRVRDLILARTG